MASQWTGPVCLSERGPKASPGSRFMQGISALRMKLIAVKVSTFSVTRVFEGSISPWNCRQKVSVGSASSRNKPCHWTNGLEILWVRLEWIVSKVVESAVSHACYGEGQERSIGRAKRTLGRMAFILHVFSLFPGYVCVNAQIASIFSCCPSSNGTAGAILCFGLRKSWARVKFLVSTLTT